METLKARNWDAVRDMDSPESVMAYIESALEESDFSNPGGLKLFLAVLSDIARSNGMAKIARDLHLSREELYQSLSQGGNPSFSTVMKVLNSLGFRPALRKSV
ncbi:MAG: putative addiction module antidote protein [Spirochaetaceae bacterium]|jgi:probable addiction module antidote protein|nr:putative addiction module antidote protein [Spirochaetaceae bacterium]